MLEGLKLSNSTISIYYDCQRCFWLHFNKGLKRPQGIFSGMPIVIDSLLKKHISKFRTVNEMPSFMELIKGRIAVDADWAKVKSMSYKDPVTGFELVGKPDELFFHGMELYSFGDYKTAGKGDGNIYDAYYRQQDIYMYLAEKTLNMKMSGMAYLIYFYPVMDSESLSLIPIKFDSVIKPIKAQSHRVPSMLEEIKKCLSSRKIPDSGKECGYCSYAKTYAGETK